MLRCAVLFAAAALAASAQWDEVVAGHSFIVSVDGARIHCVDELSDPSVEKAIDWNTVKSAKIFDAVSVKSAFEVNYSGFTTEARTAFERAIEIWDSVPDVDVPIEIDAEFGSLPERRLGGARAPWWSINRTLGIAAPSGLVNQIVGRDLRPADADIEIVLSKSYGGWYFGLDGNPGEEEHNFVTVVLHEIAHGLGFADSFNMDSSDRVEYGLGDDNIPTIFDSHIWTFTYEEGYRQLTDEDDYQNRSDELSEAVTGHRLYWRGDATGTANSGSGWPVLLWAPPSYSQGTSIAHLDEDAFPPGDPDSLMVPFAYRGYSYPYPGPILKAMLADMGWRVRVKSLYLMEVTR